jgi:hypothetical protein
MIVLLIAALAIAALLAGGITIARSHAREQERRDRTHRDRLAAAVAESRAEEERRQAALAASDALTSVLPAIRPPWTGQPQGSVPDGGGSPSLSDYPRFPAAVPFQAQDQPALHRDEMTGTHAPAGLGANGQAERSSGHAAEPVSAQAERAHRRPGPGSHRGGHAKRRRG